ncbi:MAG: hopanoid biosynthesis associated protein HpnK [Verrucomicrobiales bacterium]|nr:hopanoid biosynthesis associated protein HpnK [Verrucomicrobiales bacterium]
MIKRLIVNADDFGRSASINEAVVAAHRSGILTTGSLMVNESAAEEAAKLARNNPALGVGLHLSLICGAAALSSGDIPGLLSSGNRFSENPAVAGTRYFFGRDLYPQLEREISAQFARFRATGLPLDHVNGHLHFHLHPTVLKILLRNADTWGIKTIRLTSDPLPLNLRIAGGRWFYRLSHALIFSLLSRRAAPLLAQRQIKHTDRVFGLLQNALAGEDYVLRLLDCLPDGISELFSHPSTDQFRNEFEALISPRVRQAVTARNIELIRYQDLL